MIIQSEFIFENNDDFQNMSKTTKIFMVFCLLAACCYATWSVILYELKGKVNTTIALQYIYIGQALFNSLAMTFQ